MPDNRSVAFRSDREGDRAIWVQAIDGSGAMRLTTPEEGQEHIPESWSPAVLLDGRFVGLIAPSGSDAPVSGNQIRVVVSWFEELKRLVPTDSASRGIGSRS